MSRSDQRLRVGRSLLWGAIVILVLSSSARSGKAQAIAIESIEPGRTDSTLVCTLTTRGLPDGRSIETLESGLPSAMVIALALLDPAGHELGGSRAEIRIEPDLWEGLLVLRTPLLDQRLTSVEELRQAIRQLGPLPILPLDAIRRQPLVRVRARLAIYPLAPAEIRRVHALFGGEEEEPDRREVSIGIGSLVRFFLGGQPQEDWVAEAVSPPFAPTGLVEK